MMRLLSTLLVLNLPVVFPSVQIHGVAPSNQTKYLNAEILCVMHGKATNLPIARVNDDFCDCDDGDDEPGTAACSHVLTSKFYCENDGFFAEKIHTSRIRDGVCDCCDGSDEKIDGKSSCPNMCAAAAEKYRKKAKQRLEMVKVGFEKRQAAINGEIATYFEGIKESEMTSSKELAALELLRDRVTVHKDREELREKKYRLEVARQMHGVVNNGGASEETSRQQSSERLEKEAVDTLEFETLDAIRVADDNAPINAAEDERASEVLDSNRHTVKSLIELPDGTRISLANYLRMDHNKHASSKRSPPRTAEEMRREDFLGPLFNGGEDGRKKVGLHALRVIGIVISPVRALVEVLLLSSRALWRVLSTPKIAGPIIDKLPRFPSPSRSVWFRRLGGGSVYDVYNWAMWSAQVVWDAPVYAYHYLFPTLDDQVKLPVAESLRTVLSEIVSDISKLEKEQNEKREVMKTDYGPDRAFFALKDKCIEKRIEKYVYKFCAFEDVKQDQTKLGNWDGWEGKEAGYTKMRYLNGQKCYNGPERSVLVHLECGDNDEILSVDEPSTCMYEMAVRSPLACTAQVFAQAQEDATMWT